MRLKLCFLACLLGLCLPVLALPPLPPEGSPKSFRNADAVPLRFVELFHPDDYVVTTPQWGGSPGMEDEALQPDVSSFSDILLLKDAYLLGQKTPGSDYKARPPLKLLTSPLDSASANDMLARSNRLSPSKPSVRPGMLHPETLAYLFDVVDLFGCFSVPEIYGLINRLDNSGTLVLPFNGVDLRQITSLPRRIQRLVIYQTEVTPKLDDLIAPLNQLDELVLWGCRYNHKIVPPSGNESLPKSDPLPEIDDTIFPKMAGKIRTLRLIKCSDNLVGTLGGHSWPRLERLDITDDADVYFWKCGPWDFLTRTHQGHVTCPRPSYPALRWLTVYQNLSVERETSWPGGREAMAEFIRKTELRASEQPGMKVDVVFIRTR